MKHKTFKIFTEKSILVRYDDACSGTWEVNAEDANKPGLHREFENNPTTKYPTSFV